MLCKFCGKECKSNVSLTNHQRTCKKNPDRTPTWLELNQDIVQNGRGNQHTKAKETGVPFVISDDTREKLKAATFGKRWSEERKQNHSIAMKRVALENPDSYSSSNRGRTKIIEKHGMKFQGKWELSYYEWCVENSVSIVRCTEWFPYIWNGSRMYNPDFYLPDEDVYIEIKGYETERDRAKWRDFPKTLRVLKAKELKEILGR